MRARRPPFFLFHGLLAVPALRVFPGTPRAGEYLIAPIPCRSRMLEGPKLHSKESMLMDFNYRREENYRGNTGTHHGQVSQAGEMAESEMIHRAKRRDAAAFESLYKLHSRRIYALCLRMLGNISEAEDLTQEAFLQLFRKIHMFRGESAFSTWLHRMAVNLVLMRLRRKAPPQGPLEGAAELSGAKRQSFRKIGRADLSLDGSIDLVCLEFVVDHTPTSEI